MASSPGCTQAAGAQLDDAVSRGLSKAQAWNSAGAALFKASRVHCVFNIATIFVKAVNDAAATEAADADVASHRLAATLKTVCDLYILHYLSEVCTKHGAVCVCAAPGPAADVVATSHA